MNLVRERLEGDAAPLAIARWLRGEHRPVVLAGRWLGGGVLLTSHPQRVATAYDDPIELLDGNRPLAAADLPASREAVGGGWFGWLGYGLGRMLERLPPPPPRPHPLPLFDLAYHDHLVRCDRNGEWWFEALWTEARAEVLEQRLATWRARLLGEAPPPRPVTAGPLTPAGGGTTAHRRAVAEIVERIWDGDLSQANVCMRLTGSLRGDPLDLWIEAIAVAPPDYAAFVGSESHAVLSLSPELFLRRRGRTVATEPIKGTAPGSSDPEALQRSEKDRAENVMIVDLMRNDLGRVCDYGSIAVDRLCEVKPAAGVWHLVSRVSGRLRQGVGDGELLRATFPPGSVTGAPKIRAMGLIYELEGTAREAYCGAVGLSSPLSGLELNVAIRTFETRDGHIWLGAGGGIVADSEPEAEVDEAMTKARGVAAIAGIEILGRGAPGGPVSGRVRHTRPDPEVGVLETILVRGGAPVWLDAHLARLNASCETLGVQLHDDLHERIVNAACELTDAGLRVLADRFRVDIIPRPLPTPRAVRLAPTVLPGGLGEHKWADRRLIDDLSVAGCTPLFLDLDGTVLEAGHAAVALVVGQTLIVPPLDGRILPSISRANLLTTARHAGYEVRLETFTLTQARAADALILISALRGPHVGTIGPAEPTEQAVAVCEELTMQTVDLEALERQPHAIRAS